MRPQLAPALVALAALTAVLAPGAFAADVLTRHPVVTFKKGGAAYAFDAARRRLFMVGGLDDADVPTTQLLELSPYPKWTRPEILGTPPPVTLFESAVYDSLRDRILVFTPANSGVWSLNLAAPMTWTVLHPTGPRPALSGAQIIYDSARDRIVGYGGFVDAAIDPAQPTIGAVWSLSLGASPAWTVLESAGGAPPTRAQGAAIYDPVLDRMVLFGGFTRLGTTVTERNDTWQLSFVGGIPTWNPIVPTGTSPAARHATAAVFDPLCRRLVLMGGIQNGSAYAARDAQWLDLDVPAWHPVENTTLDSRYGAAAAYDAAGSRMILAGGIDPTALRGPKGDAWQLLLGPVPGPWERMRPSGEPLTSYFTGYDPVGHGFATLDGSAPAFLSVLDRTWSSVPSANPLPVNLVGRHFDFRTNTLWAFTLDSLYSIQPAPFADWTRKAIAGPRPSIAFATTQFFDARRERVLMIGWSNGLEMSWTHSEEFWILSLGPSPAWTLVAPTTPLRLRGTPGMFDARRDRVLFFGGSVPNGSIRPYSLGDLHALDLSTLTWSVPATTGTPPTPRYGFAAAYDSLRDRAVIFGGIQYSGVQGGVYYLSFDPSGVGEWQRRDPLGEFVGSESGLGVVDPILDRFFVGEMESVQELQWGPARVATIACPSPTVWTPGAVLPLTFSVAQDEAAAHSYEWAVRSARNWPGFPLHGFVDLPGTAPLSIEVGIPVPDSVAAGSNALEFIVTDVADPAVGDSCVMPVTGIARPARTVALACPNPTPWTPGANVPVTLTVSQGEAVPHSYDWTVRSERNWPGFPLQGVVHLENTAALSFEVGIPIPDSVSAGANELSIVLRDVVDSAVGDSCVLVVAEEAPGGVPAIAFDHPDMFVHGALDVEFTLSGDGDVRLEAFDLAGRRAATRVERGLGAGSHVVTLAPAGALRSGIYFLRLTHAGRAVRGRALVFPGP